MSNIAIAELTSLRERVSELESQEAPLKRVSSGTSLEGNFTVSGNLSAGGTVSAAGNLSAGSSLFLSNRLALSDTGDGWLRLNNSGQSTNGVYTPGNFRADGNLVAGLARSAVGVHPVYGAAYSGFWRLNADGTSQDYALLFSNTDTMLNSGGGDIYFRNNNVTRGTIGQYGLNIVKSIQVGDVASDYFFGAANWNTGGANLVLNSKDYSSIAFHDSNNRIDGIMHAGNVFYVGANHGWGVAHTKLEGCAAVNQAAIDGNIALNVKAVASVIGLRVTNSAGTSQILDAWDSGAISVNGAIATANHAFRIRPHTDDSNSYPLVVTDAGVTKTMFHIAGYSSTQVTGFLRNTAWSYSSDDRLKDDITDDTEGLDKLKKLRAIKFNYKGSNKRSRGFSAQELQKELPDLVDELEDGTLAIRTTDLIPLLLNAVKELSEANEDLAKRLTKLEKRDK